MQRIATVRLVVAALACAPGGALAEISTRVYLNGQPTPVYFNDGDSFRVLAGPLEGTKARLAGFNTLESFGPVHRWGGWTAYELYANAKQGTYNARKGTWHCESDMSRDGYGRILWHCPDLVLSQIRNGFAHAYVVGEEPAPFEVLVAQREAQEARRGMWAHGIPAYVLTSIHSLSEDPSRPMHYNRLISTVDGRSREWSHRNNYGQCDVVCSDVESPREEVLLALADEVLKDQSLARGLGEFSRGALSRLLGEYWRHGTVSLAVREPARAPLQTLLDGWRAAGRFGAVEKVQDACMTYVDFRERFGAARAKCLDKH